VSLEISVGLNFHPILRLKYIYQCWQVKRLRKKHDKLVAEKLALSFDRIGTHRYL